MTFLEVISKHASKNYSNRKILEVGSYNVNGGVKKLFKNSNYIGVDLIDGPGVDIVMSGHLLKHQDNEYDITLSTECFEHNPFWRETFLNMHRMTKDNGLLIFTCASRGRLEHGTQRTNAMHSPGTQVSGWNYYMNLNKKNFKKIFDLNLMFKDHLFIYNKKSCDLYFVGKKHGDTISEDLYFNKKLLLEENTHAQNIVENDLALSRKSEFNKQPITIKILLTLSNIIYSPTKLAHHLLPDRLFQNFYFEYDRLVKKSTRGLRYLLKKVLIRSTS